MSQRVPRSPDPNNACLPAHDVKVSFRIVNAKRRSSGSRKKQRVLVLGQVPVQDLAEFNAHWYESLFVALAMNTQNEVVQVHILARKAQQLAYPKSRVQGNQRNGMSPSLITPDGLPL
jgi:hypothetical protein